MVREPEREIDMAAAPKRWEKKPPPRPSRETASEEQITRLPDAMVERLNG